MTSHPIPENAGHWWLTCGKWRRLHAIAGAAISPERMRDSIDEADPVGARAACGLRRRWCMPGLFSRFGQRRCAACCRVLRFPTGPGTPVNEGVVQMPEPQVVYDGWATWDDIAGTARRDELMSWLRANGIDPADIPPGHTVAIETGPGGERTIRHTAYLRSAGGLCYLADPDNVDAGAATEERAVPLAVEPPMNWYVNKEHPDA